YAEKLIGLRAQMMAEIGDRSAMRGVMRLGVAETIVHTWLPRLVKSVNEIYPNLSLEIEVDITPNLTARLLAQEIELAFVVG
ncbi:LysR substrate-binding domain-containing protein, partial [Acinetobacter baumannii]